MKPPVTPWQVLKQRDFGLFWLSLLFSAVGTQISTVAIAWQVYEITNSPFQLGLTGLFRALPVMILSLPGGVLADRMDRRKLLIITQSLAALLSLALGLLSSAGQIQRVAYLRRYISVRRRRDLRRAGAHRDDPGVGVGGTTRLGLCAQYYLAANRHARRAHSSAGS